jgi:nucleotide-binding universal stress UspA family protein
MIKSILIPLDPSVYTDMALEMGCFLAKQHDAELSGLVVLDIPGIRKSVGPTPAGGSYYAEKLEKRKKWKRRRGFNYYYQSLKKNVKRRE